MNFLITLNKKSLKEIPVNDLLFYQHLLIMSPWRLPSSVCPLLLCLVFSPTMNVTSTMFPSSLMCIYGFSTDFVRRLERCVGPWQVTETGHHPLALGFEIRSRCTNLHCPYPLTSVYFYGFWYLYLLFVSIWFVWCPVLS